MKADEAVDFYREDLCLGEKRSEFGEQNLFDVCILENLRKTGHRSKSFLLNHNVFRL